MKKDAFAQVPEFLAAFNNIRKNGFFTKFFVHVGSEIPDIDSINVSFTIVGCVPSDAKYQREGFGAVVDPEKTVATCRAIAALRKVTNVTTKVETKDWPLWDKKDTKIIGSKGRVTELYLYIDFQT